MIALLLACSNPAPTPAPPIPVSLAVPTGTTASGSTRVADAGMAFFFQVMTPKGGDLSKFVRVGLSRDGGTVRSSGEDAIRWTEGPSSPTFYGDPVISRVNDQLWTLTAWSAPTDPRGRGKMLYRAGRCPQVDDREVVAIGASDAPGCVRAEAAMTGKTSTTFTANGANWLTHSVNGELGILKVGEGGSDLRTVGEICRESKPRPLASVAIGHSVPIFTQGQANGLKLSDSAITQRKDGTWVLFVKGQETTAKCEQGSICELCGRSIYRSTSADLQTWSPLEKVITQASVPEAFTDADGKVWLYYVDFAHTCERNDVIAAAFAPISGAWEDPTTHALSTPTNISFPDENLNQRGVHGATNANPVVLPNAAARAALDACISGSDPVVAAPTAASSAGTTPAAPSTPNARPNGGSTRPGTHPAGHGARPGGQGSRPGGARSEERPRREGR